MIHAWRFRSWFLLSLLWPGSISAAPAPAAKPQPQANSTIRLPAGIADPAGRIGFFASADQGIEAIDLASGKVLWQTHEAQRPLLLDGDHLLAQAGTKRNRLRILRLDVENHGHCDLESDALVLPAWVVTGEAHGHSFVTQWHLEKHHLVLDWQASAWYVGKTPPSSEESLAARKDSRGIARFDLRTGQIDVCPAPTEPSPNLGDGSVGEPPLPEQLEKKALRWQKIVGQQWKVLALEEEQGNQCLVLHSWDRHKDTEDQPKELLRGKRLLVRTTLDEQILCLREVSPSPEEQVSLSHKKQPKWWLFSVDTGKMLGHIPDEAGMNSILVLNKRVYYLVPGTLRGALDQPNVQPQLLRVVDLSSGKKLWDRPVAGKLISPPPIPEAKNKDENAGKQQGSSKK
jgi:hypothetical protein